MDYNYFSNLSDEELQETLTGYALGALEPDEMVSVDEYLQTHPELYPIVQRIEEASMALAYAAPQVSPPGAAKSTLMARVHAETEPHLRQQLAIPLPSHRAEGMPDGSTPLQSAFLAPVPYRAPAVRKPPPRRRFTWSIDGWLDFATGWKVATMASCAALLFFAITTIQLSSRLVQTNERMTQQQEALQIANADLQNTLRRVSADIQIQEQQLSSLLNVNQVVTLGSTQETDARGSLFVGEDSLILVLRGLQPLPEGQTYELWLIPEGSNPVSAGLVRVTSGESPKITADIQLSISSFAAVGLSIEQSGGSTSPDGPEGPIVMYGERGT